MKCFLLFFLLSVNAFSADCHVYGISKGPQYMNCYFQGLKAFHALKLVCRHGAYNILWKNKKYQVDQAYHEEVESGASPLVFQSQSLTLKTISLQIYSQAKLTVNGRSFDGMCSSN